MLRKAIRLEWLTIAFQVFAVILLGLVLGNSQAMKVAWVEDLLSLAPPAAFLLAARIIRKPPSPERPYGYHRSIGVAHLVAGATLVSLGGYLVIDSALGLVTAEHPAIGGVQVFGQVIWMGWLMIGAMIVAGFPPILLGHAKMKLAEDLHDKVLYADADMNKANWLTALGSSIGILGIGLGWWWTDSAAALFISATIVHDGVKNMRGATRDLMDARARTYDDARPHPVITRSRTTSRASTGSRSPESGFATRGVFHVEGFVVPEPGWIPHWTPWTRLAATALTWTGVPRTRSSCRSVSCRPRFSRGSSGLTISCQYDNMLSMNIAHVAVYDTLPTAEIGYLLVELRTGRFTGQPFEIVTVGSSTEPITMGGLRSCPTRRSPISNPNRAVC